MIHTPFTRLQERIVALLFKRLKLIYKRKGLVKHGRKKKQTNSLFLLLKIGGFSIFFSLPLLIFSIYHLVFWSKIYPFTQVAGKEVSGKTKTQAAAILNNLVEHKSIQTINFVFEEKKYQLSSRDLGIQYNTQTTIEKAYDFGRKELFLDNLRAKAYLWQNKANFPLDYKLNEKNLESFLATVSAQINSPAIPATIEIVNKKIVVEPGKPGQKIDIQILKQILSDRIGFLESEPIFIPVYPLLPPVTQQQAEKTRARAEKLINKTLTVKTSDFNNVLTDKELINFLSFVDDFDKQKIASWTGELAKSIDRPPQNALFRFEAGRVLEFKPAKDGLTLNKERTLELIMGSIGHLEKLEEKEALVELPVFKTPPFIKTEEVNNLGIKELIGKGESWFYGSIAGRIHNIKLAASKFNGILISPGAVFSFNENVGGIDQTHGYQQAYIIKEGRTVLGDGGGVCQVSSTLFRAALNAGLPIVERQAHAYRVSYYEYNSQVGQDATVFSPRVDLKIQNDTPAHILIQTSIDVANQKLTFELYGTSDGRKIELSKTRIWDQVAPPPPLYQDDPTTPTGVVKQVDWAAWGAKTAFDWKVTRGNEVLQEKTFYSNYRPWQAVFLKGIGG